MSLPKPGGDRDDIRVVVADDQTAIREALAMMLDLQPDIEVMGAAENGAVAVELVERYRPDVLLTDLRMPQMDGVEATRQVCERFPDTAVVLLTTYDDDVSILAALQAGALGYLTKDAGRQEIAAAIRSAASGQSVLDPAVQHRLVQVALGSANGPAAPARASSVAGDHTDHEPGSGASGQDHDAGPQPAGSPGAALTEGPDALTPRELEVLGLIGQGLSNREIARRIFVSEATVKTHINNLFSKTGLRDRAQAVRLAYANGLSTS